MKQYGQMEQYGQMKQYGQMEQSLEVEGASASHDSISICFRPQRLFPESNCKVQSRSKRKWSRSTVGIRVSGVGRMGSPSEWSWPVRVGSPNEIVRVGSTSEWSTSPSWEIFSYLGDRKQSNPTRTSRAENSFNHSFANNTSLKCTWPVHSLLFTASNSSREKPGGKRLVRVGGVGRVSYRTRGEYE